MRFAGMLIDYGLDIENIYARLYMKSREIINYKDMYIISSNNTQWCKLYYISETHAKKYNVDAHNAANLVNTLDAIQGSLIWMIFVEQPDNSIRVRLRSRFIAIDDIANQFNGGGHAQASGATVYNKSQMKQLITLADEKLKTFKENNKDVF